MSKMTENISDFFDKNLIEAINESDKPLTENYGDTKDYSDEIDKSFRKWFKENADRWIRATQWLTNSYDLDIDREEVTTKEGKAFQYVVVNNSPLVDVQDYADEIGEYISDQIPALRYVKHTYIDEKGNENNGDITWYFIQQVGMPDFGKEFDESEDIQDMDDDELKALAKKEIRTGKLNIRKFNGILTQNEVADIIDADDFRIIGKYNTLKGSGLAKLVDSLDSEQIRELCFNLGIRPQLESEETKEYRYITNHGVGPGALPDGTYVRSEDLEHGKTAIYTNRPLTDEELKKYDIKPEWIQEDDASTYAKFNKDYKVGDIVEVEDPYNPGQYNGDYEIVRKLSKEEGVGLYNTNFDGYEVKPINSEYDSTIKVCTYRMRPKKIEESEKTPSIKKQLKLLLRDLKVAQDDLYYETGFHFDDVKTQEDLDEVKRLFKSKGYYVTESINNYLDNTDYDDLETEYEKILWQINLLWRERKEKLNAMKDKASDEEIENIDSKYRAKIDKLKAKAEEIPEEARGEAYKQDNEEFIKALATLHSDINEDVKLTEQILPEPVKNSIRTQIEELDNLIKTIEYGIENDISTINSNIKALNDTGLNLDTIDISDLYKQIGNIKSDMEYELKNSDWSEEEAKEMGGEDE